MKRALILAAGKGERLRPLTLRSPKPLLQVAEKPILQWQLEMLSDHDVTDVTIHTSYLGWKIEEYFGSGDKLGLNIDYIKTTEPVGTGTPLHYFVGKHQPEEPFLVTNGDNFIRLDVTEIFEYHEAHEKVATVALVESNMPENYGVAVCDGDTVTAFIEKPTNPPTRLINAGIYVFNPEVVDYMPSLKKKKKQMIEYDLFPTLAGQGELTWFMPVDVWLPIDTVDAFYAVKQSIEAFRMGKIR